VQRDTREVQRDTREVQRDTRELNRDTRELNRDTRQNSRDHNYDNRNNNRDYRNNGSYNHNNSRQRESYRNGIPRSDGRVTMLGHINRYERSRGGYNVWFVGSPYPYWVTESYFRGHRISVGLDIRLGGIFRNGSVYVDVLGYPGDPYYNDPYYNDGYYEDGYYANGGYADNGLLSGIIDRVDRRTETLFVRDARGGIVAVDMRSIDWRRSRLDINDLRPGDRATFSGSWVRGGLFSALRIDSISAY